MEGLQCPGCKGIWPSDKLFKKGLKDAYVRYLQCPSKCSPFYLRHKTMFNMELSEAEVSAVVVSLKRSIEEGGALGRDAKTALAALVWATHVAV